MGEAALEAILEDRSQNGPFKNLTDFCIRADSGKVNRKVIECLIKAGVFDSLNANRAQLMAMLDAALDRAKAVQRQRQSGQMSLFGMGGGEAMREAESAEVEAPSVDNWPELQRLNYEKEIVGFSLSGHPLESVAADLRQATSHSLAALATAREGQADRECREGPEADPPNRKAMTP